MNASIDNPLPCPWPGADKQGKACLCVNCQGVGELPHFRHIADGVCFWCKGRGWLYNPNGSKGSKPRNQRKTWRKVNGQLISA